MGGVHRMAPVGSVDRVSAEDARVSASSWIRVRVPTSRSVGVSANSSRTSSTPLAPWVSSSSRSRI
ncbi:hypothetical protein ACFPM0_23185 [Pseudonocardia sulfidoxydans]|uniref:hypothetical protein n=1 Tax=Pseudonocardia sulfidoxydans TaxID=54011 RepID=UPI003617C823